jgi:ATP phosphoribosyltransferase
MSIAEGPRIAVPSSGRFREGTLRLLDRAGYAVGGLHGSAAAEIEGATFIEMRARDAAHALAVGRLDATFCSTDIAWEAGIRDRTVVPLGFSRSDLVIASRITDGPSKVEELDGLVVATHLPNVTREFLEGRGVKASHVLPMNGSLEGVCAAGLVDAIVDLRDTGTALARNSLRALEVIERCQACLVIDTQSTAIDQLRLRIGAVMEADEHVYVMLHLPPDQVHALSTIVHGLEAPTVVPLAERTDVVAVHFILTTTTLWSKLGELRTLGATGIVAVPPAAILR